MTEEKIDDINDESKRKNMDNEQPQKIEIVNKKKSNGLIYFIGIVALVAIVVFGGNIDEFNNWFDTEPTTDILPADVELYKFIDIVNDCSDSESKYIEISVELWLINLGDENARNITVFVRVRDYRGRTVFSEYLDMTALVLRPDETCSGTYGIQLNATEIAADIVAQKQITHTIEIMWSEGRNSYQKETTI